MNVLGRGANIGTARAKIPNHCNNADRHSHLLSIYHEQGLPNIF